MSKVANNPSVDQTDTSKMYGEDNKFPEMLIKLDESFARQMLADTKRAFLNKPIISPLGT